MGAPTGDGRAPLSAVRLFRPEPSAGPALHPRRLVLGLVALAVPLGALGGLTDRAIERALAGQVANELEGTLSTAVEGLETWVEETSRVARAAASDPAVLAAAACPPVPADGRERHGCGPGALTRALQPFLRAGGFVGFALVDHGPDRAARSAGGPLRDVWLAPDTPVRRHLQQGFQLVQRQSAPLTGTVFLPPFLAEVKRPAMLTGALLPPGESMLYLQIPLPRFSRVLQVARLGASGETYAFDSRGRMLSDSRFKHQLRAAGLMSPIDESAAFVVSVRDPGTDLTRGGRPVVSPAQLPLTRMVAQALGGDAGHDVAGYRDYRGVMVVGAWRWLGHHGFGVTTEIDRDEAFRTLRAVRRFFLALLALMAALAAGLGMLTRIHAVTRTRARQAEQKVAELGQYRILSRLGQGGMGTVYLATHSLLRRPTAIKVLRSDRSSPESVARFEQEVRATSELTHPNTVAVYDYGQTPDGLLYYAMEYLEGASFETLIRRYGPLPPARVIHLVRQVCGSLAEAHQRGLIHRDITPNNLFLCRRGGQADLVKVLDFGVAKWYQRSPQVTESNLVIGTPEYMAPELFEASDAASPLSDLYSLGAVAYHLLTGQRVFDETTLLALGTAHLSRLPIPPSERLGRPIEPALEAAVLSCLAKQPESRPSSAASLSWLLAQSPAAADWDQDQATQWWHEHEQELLDEGAKARAQ